jgi:hypothetical protein
MGLHITMVVVQRQLHQMVEQVHDCHHDKRSLPVVELSFVVFFDEWFIALLGFFTQLVLLHFDVH